MSKIVVGKDIIELLGSAMYRDPLCIYREYIQNAVDSMRLGAVDFLEKPFRSQALLESISKAFDRIINNLDINRRLGLLSTRELEFLEYIKEGLSVKSISHQLNISPKTGHAHRRSIHQKMGVDSDAFLVKILQSLEPCID